MDVHFSCLYFGYASNLSARTLKQRCPESANAGLARLEHYKWQINETGYANIIPSEGDIVYGSLAFLSDRDEAALDQSEGVPWLYEKHDVEVVRIDKDGKDLHRGNGGIQTVTATTYIDVKRTEDGRVNPDYIIWCNRAIEDAVKDGLPRTYADKYIRPYVPARDETEHDRSTNMIRLPYTMALPDGANWSNYGAGTSRNYAAKSDARSSAPEAPPTTARMVSTG